MIIYYIALLVVRTQMHAGGGHVNFVGGACVQARTQGGFEGVRTNPLFHLSLIKIHIFVGGTIAS